MCTYYYLLCLDAIEETYHFYIAFCYHNPTTYKLLYSITDQFRSWIEDSRINQLDEETEVMIAEMKRKVARHRWRRAISAVILSYRISGGKPPKWDSPVVAPGCENQNRFVDMKAMVSEAMRTQPKYFIEGSVMHNLMEAGIE